MRKLLASIAAIAALCTIGTSPTPVEAGGSTVAWVWAYNEYWVPVHLHYYGSVGYREVHQFHLYGGTGSGRLCKKVWVVNGYNWGAYGDWHACP